MSLVKITTLTPIHIGNGNFLQNNTDFVAYKSANDSYFSIIDPQKVLDLIGIEHIADWVLAIENKRNVIELVKQYDKYAHPRNYAKRIITNYAHGIKSPDTLKECIHNGMGNPYIPGSSIKGAIRTAILSSLAKGKPLEFKIKGKNGKISAKSIEADFFGKDPNCDVFRFLQIGDAYFEKESEIATRMINLNIRKQENLQDRSKSQLVEAIGAENTALFQLKIANEYYSWVKSKWNKEGMVGSLPKDMESLPLLFQAINGHTRILVKSEIKYWNELSGKGYNGAEDYLSTLEFISDEIRNCQNGKECVLRIGHGSGWRFITGAWSECLNNFKEIIAASRPNNNRYTQYDFPKSRRIDEDGDVLGFVKLSMN